MFVHLLESLESRRLLSAGDPDPSFGTDGRVLHAGTDFIDVNDAVVLEDDKILLAGRGGPDRYVLQRYNADGTLDTSFGTNGTTAGEFAGFENSSGIIHVFPLPGGKFLAEKGIDADQGILAQFNADGSLDTSFADQGVLDPKKGALGYVAVYPDGKFLVDSFSFQGITRHNADGSVDTSFADAGTTTQGIPGQSTLGSLFLLPDGKLLLGGNTVEQGVQHVAITELNADGTLNRNFGDNGSLLFTVPGSGDAFGTAQQFAQLDNGQLLVAGIEDRGFFIARFNADGTIDPSYGNSGTLVGFGIAAQLGTLQIDDAGRAVLLGVTTSSITHLAAARVNADGSFDTTFGSVVLPDSVSGLATGGLDSHGNVILVNSAVAGSDRSVLIERLTGDGNEPSPISFDPNTHSVTVTGTSGADGVEIRDPSNQGGVTNVFLNDFGRAFSPQDLQSLSVLTGAGNDNIAMAFSVPDPTTNIDAGDGDDTVRVQTSGKSPVIIQAGAGNDNVAVADENSPTVHGGDGNDAIKSGAGQQFLYGDGGNDTIHAGGGSDLVNGGGGKDHLFGQQGKDRLYGGNGDDAIDGGSGDDRIFGGAGIDKLFGGSGNDSFNTVDGERDFLFGDGGHDSADADPSDVLTSIESTF